MKIQTKFDVNSKIYITDLKIWGKIKAIFIDNEQSYKVRFFDGKDPKECYFLEDELSLKEEENKLGFKNE